MPQQDRYICIHGHFYQPPRENPWLETVETQDSAAPYHDWNERITAECYATNGASRIVNEKNQIIRILNNYARISFNFGPTLLSWLEENAPRTYRMILDADRRSEQRYSGHGSAMAQVYNHIIMPLANTRDRVTQIRWGIADFEHRFGRKPEGMWLPETAVDTESLELLAEHGIRYTVLAPEPVRPGSFALAQLQQGRGWPGLGGFSSLDAKPPTPASTPRSLTWFGSKTGRSIAVYFYDGPRSRAIAFEGLLNSGDTFASRLMAAFATTADRASWCTWPPMAKAMATIIAMARWRSLTRMKLIEKEGQREADELRRIPREISAHLRGADCGRHLLELRSRSGTLAFGLRLQRRPWRLESATGAGHCAPPWTGCAIRWRR